MENNYGIFYTGLASTPNSIGLMNWTTKEKISEISCSRRTGKATRAAYERYSAILKQKYKTTVN